MTKGLIRSLNLLGSIRILLSGVVIDISLLGSTTTATTGIVIASTGQATLFILGFGVGCIGVLFAYVGWLSGLILTAQLRQWGWFISILIFGSLLALLYSLVPSRGSSLSAPANAEPDLVPAGQS